MYAGIVVGADGSETAAEAVKHAAELAKQFGAHLHIVSAYKATPLDTRGLPSEMSDAVRGATLVETLLADLSSRLRPSGITVSTHAIKGDAADALLGIAADEKADLIVVGNKGMRGARRVLGSIPNTVAHQAPCAVLIVHTR
ncbi:MAG: universal stress protein [Actinomycetota bacterium]